MTIIERRLLWIALGTVMAIGYLMMFARAIEVNSSRIETIYWEVGK